MGRAPCCDKANVKKGPWSPEEDAKLKDYIAKHGTGGNWIAFPQKAGLKRCGKSCRLRWLNYLRPNIRHGEFSDDEDRIICTLYSHIGSRWSIIAGQLPGRTDNDIKNYWNTKLKKKILMGSSCQMRKPIQPNNFQPLLHASSSLPSSPLSTDPLSYTTLARSFTDPILFSSSPNLSINSSASASSTNLYNQESFLDPTQHQFQGKKQNLIVFGGGSGDQTSNCSSNSDEQIVFQSNCLYNELVEQKQKQKMVISDGLWGEINPLDYGLEEIKQLISSTGTVTAAATTSFCNNFMFDEIKTEEKVMYY